MLGSMIPSNRRMIGIAAALVAIGVGIGVAVDRLAFAQQPNNGIKRTILQRVDEPGAPNYEAVMAIAEIAPGASSGRHRHPGVELAYVLEGSLVVERDGQAPYTARAGDAIKNEAAVHNAKNIGKTPVKILAVYLVEKGKPMAEPVP
jgi:quercetin dioxygenase-like cupin family protein